VGLAEFNEHARELVASVAQSGDSIIISDGDEPIAMVGSLKTVPSMATMVDLPQWAHWIEQMRAAFPEAASGAGQPRLRQQQPEEIDKTLLGFDPGTGALGSAAGREFLTSELKRLGVPVVDEALLDTIYAGVLHLCEDKERIFDEDIRVLAQELIAEAPQRLRLHALTVQSTTGLPAMAEVTLELGQGPAMRREQGDGPLDAAFNAIEKITGLSPEVENFSVVAATKGRDAMAEAMIQMSLEGTTVVGAGASTNAIEAGVHAYLNALNFLLEARRPAASPGAGPA
jgi:antitoxin (DNA-binding transcriptional repressor) of toxin-antitoxin stability system